MSHAHAGIDRQPVCGRVLILSKGHLHVTGRRVSLTQCRRVARLQPEEHIVMLIETIRPDTRRVRALRDGERHLRAGVLRCPMIGRHHRIVRSAVECGSVVMVKGRDGQERV